MMKRILFTATVDEHILHFHVPYLKWFQEQGYEVHVASNGDTQIPYTNKKMDIPFERSPFDKANLTAYRQLKKIIDTNAYELIHCHTPMGGVVTRLAAMGSRKQGTKVMYTAHGFHFFKGAPLKNWLFYYPVEKWLSLFTDCLITINDEDHRLALNKHFGAASIIKVNGVGVDLAKYYCSDTVDKYKLREQYGYDEQDFIMIYAAELSYRKNQTMLIRTVHRLRPIIPNIKLLLAGTGGLAGEYAKLISELGLDSNVHLLGYRKDIQNLMTLSDIAVSSARQEGLPVNIMEAMAVGLPLVVTGCRGNQDLISDNGNGLVVKQDDMDSFANAVIKIYQSEELRERFRNESIQRIQAYSIDRILHDMTKVYREWIGCS
jgi:glycosyltransferase EpsD